MRVTGVVRKIDELGRIVIPKEIRRNLKINEGTPMEIFVNNDELVFKKFSPLFELSQLIEYCAQSIAETFDIPFLIFDTEKCLATNKLSKKEYLDKPLNPEIQKIIEKHELFNQNNSLFTGYSYLSIIPIEYMSDIFGYIIVPHNQFDKSTYVAIKMLSLFLAKQLQY